MADDLCEACGTNPAIRECNHGILCSTCDKQVHGVENGKCILDDGRTEETTRDLEPNEIDERFLKLWRETLTESIIRAKAVKPKRNKRKQLEAKIRRLETCLILLINLDKSFEEFVKYVTETSKILPI